MVEGKLIDAVLTDDESELVTIIDGLEAQAEQQEVRLGEVRSTGTVMTIGAAASVGMVYIEKGAIEKLELLTLSAGFLIGGFERLIRERKMVKSIRAKNILASRLKQELDPADLERYEERHDLDFDDEDD